MVLLLFIHTVCTLTGVWQSPKSPPPPGKLVKWWRSPYTTLSALHTTVLALEFEPISLGHYTPPIFCETIPQRHGGSPLRGWCGWWNFPLNLLPHTHDNFTKICPICTGRFCNIVVPKHKVLGLQRLWKLSQEDLSLKLRMVQPR